MAKTTKWKSTNQNKKKWNWEHLLISYPQLSQNISSLTSSCSGSFQKHSVSWISLSHSELPGLFSLNLSVILEVWNVFQSTVCTFPHNIQSVCPFYITNVHMWSEKHSRNAVLMLLHDQLYQGAFHTKFCQCEGAQMQILKHTQINLQVLLGSFLIFRQSYPESTSILFSCCVLSTDWIMQEEKQMWVNQMSWNFKQRWVHPIPELILEFLLLKHTGIKEEWNMVRNSGTIKVWNCGNHPSFPLPLLLWVAGIMTAQTGISVAVWKKEASLN